MELQHFSHEHPLVFIEERSHETEKVYCSGCGELVSSPSFSCMTCRFYLDKKCAEAPSEMKHPFHRIHSLNLLKEKPYKGSCRCDFCKQICKNFLYHCSCKLDLHIKCALLSCDIGEKRIAEFQHIARIDPLISTENHTEKLKKAMCFACWKPLLDSVYFSADCGFYLHAKCVELPEEINHLLHQHPLILQFNSQRLSCKICRKKQSSGFVYCCPPCKFVLHIECAAIPTKINNLYHPRHPLILEFKKDVGALLCQICQQTQHKKIVYYCSVCKFALHIDCASAQPAVIKDKGHEHPFIQFQRHVLFTCDACGIPGKYESYICVTCSIMVHKKCISLPKIIQFYRHQHHICHKYILEGDEFGTWDCRICHEKVNTKHGSYLCSKCNFIVHVNCALKDRTLYRVVDSIETDEAMDLAFEPVTATSIKHFSHDHNLSLTEDIKGHKQCDGCLLSVSTSSYYCSQCDFFLHKACAELPMKKHFWYHRCLSLPRLTWGSIFECAFCGHECSGFAYTCDKCKKCHCLRCALVSDIFKCQGHEHPLLFYGEYEGSCDACGDSTKFAYSCKGCSFVLHQNCIRLPLTARHKSDAHPLILTYHDENKYPESHYCDICEEQRHPKRWFYYCEFCDSSAHPKCVLGRCTFIKLGSIYRNEDHPHALTFVQVHYYPECHKCGKLCLDLALKCKTIGCSYIVQSIYIYKYMCVCVIGSDYL